MKESIYKNKKTTKVALNEYAACFMLPVFVGGLWSNLVGKLRVVILFTCTALYYIDKMSVGEVVILFTCTALYYIDKMSVGEVVK